MAPDIELNSQPFRSAVANIQKRAEKLTDRRKLEELFVPTDVRDRVETTDPQLILGRRGTGKTHLVRAFEKSCTETGKLALYFDCTRLGSGYSGLNLPASTIASKYFTALLSQLGTDLHDYSINMENPDPGTQNTVWNGLVNQLTPAMAPNDRDGAIPTYDYPRIARTLEEVIRSLAPGRVFIVLDEWAQVPFNAQPHFAEYIKRAISVVPSISLKILAVNYQCQLSTAHDTEIIGMERGADLPDVIDLDRYLVYDERGDFVISFFAQVLYNHLGVELGWDLRADADAKHHAVVKLFTQADAFVNLVRAAEGNCRDFLCVFYRAYFDEFRQSHASKAISKPNVVKAATTWFDSEKAANLKSEPDAQNTLAFLLDRVLKGYKSRTFLVKTSMVEHPRLSRLLNERVVHRLNVTYSSPAEPGARYELFTIDYGAFARFRSTKHQINEHVFLDGTNAARELVPIDDKRSIRRIIFDPESRELDGYLRNAPHADTDLPLWNLMYARPLAD